jgi:deoxyhypusine synthase
LGGKGVEKFTASCPLIRGLQVYADATIVFPLIVSQTFAKDLVPTDD